MEGYRRRRRVLFSNWPFTPSGSMLVAVIAFLAMVILAALGR